MIDTVRFVFEEAISSMEDPWDEGMMDAVLGTFEAGYKATLTSNGFEVSPKGSSRLTAKMSEYQGTIFIEAIYPDDEGNFQTACRKMAFNQEKAKTVFNKTVNALLEA